MQFQVNNNKTEKLGPTIVHCNYPWHSLANLKFIIQPFSVAAFTNPT